MAADSPKPLATRLDLFRITMEEVTPEKWRRIVSTAADLAIAGDTKARDWVTTQVGMAHAHQVRITLDARAEANVTEDLAAAHRKLLVRAATVAMSGDDARGIAVAAQLLQQAKEAGTGKKTPRPVFATDKTLPALLEPKKDGTDG